MVAVGTEEARSFGGEAAVFALLRESRREAATAMAEEAFRNHVPSPYDGTMRFGLAPKIGAALNDVETRDELFEACGRNWREFTPVWKSNLQTDFNATHGDCDEPQPHDPRSRSLWFPWHKLLGLGHGEAKVRFIRKLYSIRPALVIPRLPGRPPPGFPRTAIGGKPICALCNSRRGCQEPLVVVPPGAPPNARPVTLKAALDDMELLRSAEKTHALLDAALAEPRCEHGSHERVGPGIYKAFASYYALPGLGGFALYKDIDDKTGKTTAWEGVARCYEQAVEREHVAHDWLHERVEHRKRSAPSAEKEAWRAARDEQAAVCVVLREAYAAWTGRAFKMRSECDKWESDQCNRRRQILDGGRNHSHWLSDASLPSRHVVQLETTYRGLVEARRGAARVGAPTVTGTFGAPEWVRESPFLSEPLRGPNLAVVDRASVLGEQIAVEHRKYAVAAEARASIAFRDGRKASKQVLIKTAATKESKGGLLRAIANRELKAAVSLARHGACDVNMETKAGVTALMAAILSQDRHATSALVEAGASVDYPSRKVGSAGMSNTGDTDLFPGEDPALTKGRHYVVPPIAAAASAGQLMTIDVLVEETERFGGPETVTRLVDQNFGPDNLTALHVAVRRRDLRTCIHLVKKGARTDLGDARGTSPGELALQLQQQKLGDYLRRVRRVGRELVSSRKDQELDRCALLQFARLERAIESGGELDAKAEVDVTKTALHVIRNGDEVVAVDCHDAREAYRAARDLSKELQRERDERKNKLKAAREKHAPAPLALDEDEARNDPVKADRDTSWQWRLPREVAVSYTAGGPSTPSRGLYSRERDDDDDDDDSAALVARPSSRGSSRGSRASSPKKSPASPKKKKKKRHEGTLLEQEERLAAARKKDREDARDAAAAASVYLQTLRDPVITLKDLYRSRYGVASYGHMVKGEYREAGLASHEAYAGAGIESPDSSSRGGDDDDEAEAPPVVDDEDFDFPEPESSGPAPAPPVVEDEDIDETLLDDDDASTGSSYAYLVDDVLQRFLDGDDGAVPLNHKDHDLDEASSLGGTAQDDDSDSDDGNEDAEELGKVERRHAALFQRALQRRRANKFASAYAEAAPFAAPATQKAPGIDIDAWRAKLEHLRDAVDATNSDNYLPQAPELEYAHYMVKRGRFTEASGTLRRLLSKQKADFKRLSRVARAASAADDAAARKPKKREKDALAILSSRTGACSRTSRRRGTGPTSRSSCGSGRSRRTCASSGRATAP
ncbi:hypothetical protein JL722_12345 [Aureococcus anophagefferens]|nr:hypothetical protein JL722_12345 [Aureococcus anophagefferens]